ncbi:MFS transporter [Spirilliplanes yamanashiensis]|uniref:Major facilitator superfamily (MFS) profile domain-containing protein n=1 Tax=Spirilliplanes yamanashiensis TaxID=42233 RepID=A0A8J3Y974_9ACTN|nr:MFS transporter [Spirilliplanes yamanashiensis]MDP9815347.1 MFS family permease [Spirilliplanes yamanashiensis]GIJ03602.1 hypothetical protein Sya03_29540 [Spirilliplanes yamanashiensis]
MSFTSRWGDVYVAAGARAVSACGDFLAATSLALAFQQSGAGGTAVSALLLAASVPLVVLAPVAGRIADRVDSRTVLVVAGVAQAAVCLGLAFATHPAAIVALVAVLASGLAVTQPTLLALLPEMVRPQDMARASGINQTAGLIGMLAAPALAGVLVGQFGVRVPLLLDAASYLTLVAAGLLIRTRRAGGGTPAVRAAARGWRLRGDRLVLTMVAAVAAVVAGVSAINVIEVFFIRETLGASTTMFGLVSASWAGGMLIGAVVFGRLGHRIAGAARLVRAILLLLAGACAPITLGAAASDALLLVPLWLIGGACNGGLNVFTAVVIAERVPAAARGRAFAALSSAVQGAGMAGLVLGGPLVDAFEPRLLVAAAGGAGLLAVALCVPPVLRAVRREQRPVPLPAGESSDGASVAA